MSKTSTRKAKRMTYIEAARNPELIVLQHRSFRVQYFLANEKEKPVINRRYLRLDTGVPAAMKFLIMAGQSGDYVILSHAEFGFEIARINMWQDSIELVWDEDLINHSENAALAVQSV